MMSLRQKKQRRRQKAIFLFLFGSLPDQIFVENTRSIWAKEWLM